MKIDLAESLDRQRTIGKTILFKGMSLLTGKASSITFKPAKENSGISFSYNENVLPALIEYLEPTPIHTTALKKNDVRVFAIEHLLAAVWGLGIDNLIIELSSNAIPAQDASSAGFVNALKQAKVIQQNKRRKIIIIQDQIIIRQPKYKNRVAKLEPSNRGFEIDAVVPWSKPIGSHTVKYRDSPENFEKEISWARTFLRSPIDLENLALWERVRSIYRALPKDPKDSPIIVFTEEKFVTPIKKSDEPARHKVLDLFGDLALIGYRINGKLTITEPGHKFTHKIAKAIRKSINKKNNETA